MNTKRVSQQNSRNSLALSSNGNNTLWIMKSVSFVVVKSGRIKLNVKSTFYDVLTNWSPYLIMYERRMEDPAIAQNNYVIILNQYLHCSHC
jgi:hypothetical protein